MEDYHHVKYYKLLKESISWQSQNWKKRRKPVSIEHRENRLHGKSTTWIAKELNVSISSVSLWTRDIELTEEQSEYLRNSEARQEAQKKGAEANVIKHRRKRIKYQEEGRAKAREGDQLHLAGCMLYWGEGNKSRTEIRLTNSDPDMMIIFMRFLRESLQVNECKIKMALNFYLNNGLSQDEIESYWQDLLNIPAKRMRDSIINNQPSSSKQKGRKLPYGMCMVEVNSVKHKQHIYGAIQEYIGIDKPDWLDI